MINIFTKYIAAALILMLSLGVQGGNAADVSEHDPLPSWADGPVKSAILGFVRDVTQEGGADYVSHEGRIATFDNDGCLWVEQPMYPQIMFAVDRVRELASEHPEWASEQPFKGILEDDMASALAAGKHGLMEMIVQTHAGMTAEQFEKIVLDWLSSRKHPRFERPYTECVYQPQLELLVYLRANGFKTYIVSGGGIQFLRPWTERVYGIPPEQVVGSSVVTEYQVIDGKPALIRKPEVNFIDDKEGKPVGIYEHIGRRPILAFGNSDGDMQMIEYTTAGEGRRLGLYVHHTDAEREYAYDREGHVGKLDKALDRAEEEGWIIVDMKRDWLKVFPDAGE